MVGQGNAQPLMNETGDSVAPYGGVQYKRGLGISMGEGQLVMLSKQADREPMLKVLIEGKAVTFILDTGSTYTCVGSADAQHLSRSSTGRVAKTIGYSGQVQIIPFSTPVLIEVSGKKVRMPILI